MREIRLSGSEGGGTGNSTGSPYPYPQVPDFSVGAGRGRDGGGCGCWWLVAEVDAGASGAAFPRWSVGTIIFLDGCLAPAQGQSFCGPFAILSRAWPAPTETSIVVGRSGPRPRCQGGHARPLQEPGPPGDCAVQCILKPRTNARPLHLRQEPAMRAMTPSATYLMSPVFLDLTIENESGGVIARNVGSLQAAHERRAVVRSSPAA